MGETILRETLLAQGYVEIWHRLGSVFYEDTKGNIVAKVCRKCSKLKLIESFNKKERGIGGKHSQCGDCTSNKAKTWRETHVEHVEEKNKLYRENRIITNRMWRKNNPERKREYLQKWRSENPEKKRLADNKRRARLLGLPYDMTLKEEEKVKLFFGGCALTESNDTQNDHVIPLFVGHGGTTLSNIVPLRKDLNYSKNNAHLFEWYSWAKDSFGLSQAKFDALISYLAEVNGMTPKEYRMYVDWCFDNPRTIDDLETELTG